MDKKERLKKQLDFIMEIDKVKNIFRQTYLADGKRKENDAGKNASKIRARNSQRMFR